MDNKKLLTDEEIIQAIRGIVLSPKGQKQRHLFNNVYGKTLDDVMQDCWIEVDRRIKSGQKPIRQYVRFWIICSIKDQARRSLRRGPQFIKTVSEEYEGLNGPLSHYDTLLVDDTNIDETLKHCDELINKIYKSRDHNLIYKLKIRGFTNVEIGRITGHCESRICQIVKQTSPILQDYIQRNRTHE